MGRLEDASDMIRLSGSSSYRLYPSTRAHARKTTQKPVSNNYPKINPQLIPLNSLIKFPVENPEACFLL